MRPREGVYIRVAVVVDIDEEMLAVKLVVGHFAWITGALV